MNIERNIDELRERVAKGLNQVGNLKIFKLLLYARLLAWMRFWGI